jgi:cytoskeletal protein RodZ
MSIDLLKIGQALKEERERQGHTIRDVSEALCVRKSLVQALEAGDWQPLPHEVYVKSYVKNYANFLHNYELISELLTASLPEEMTPEMKEGAENGKRAKVREQKKPASLNTRSATKERKTRRFSRVTAVYVVILIIAAAIFVYESVDRGGGPPSEQNNVSRVKVDTQATATSTNGASGNVPVLDETKRLMISCYERTWISVVIDGREKKEFMLSPQEIIMLNAKEDFDLLIGNAGGVKLHFNGKDTEFTGKSGEVKRIKLS